MARSTIRTRRLLACATACFAASAQARVPIPITNAGFESGLVGRTPPGWLIAAGDMYLSEGSGLSVSDPTAAYTGSRFLSATWQATGAGASPFPSGQTMSLFQAIDLSPYASLIDDGGQALDLSFAYSAGDVSDYGTVRVDYYDAGSNPVGSALTFSSQFNGTASSAWQPAALSGAVPTNARSLSITLSALRDGNTGSARNVSFDSLAAELNPFVHVAQDRVAGSLIQFNANGAWSWYQDERAVVDTQRGELIVGSIANYGGIGGQAVDGFVQTAHFDLATGSRRVVTHNDLESYGGGDDHNVPALLVKDDGGLLAFYAAHNNLGGTEDDRSYYRTMDAGTGVWGPESEYHWWPQIPDNAPGSGGTTYSNVFQLSAEDPDGDGSGRLYNIARTRQSPHVMYSDDNGTTWAYGGQLTKQSAVTPSGGNYVNGYYKYVSNGEDRIDLIATEYHPRDFNTSIYHAYIRGGKMYDTQGNVIDEDIFDAAGSFDPAAVPSTDDFSLVFQAGASENSRAWNTDVQSYADGTISALFKARDGGFGGHTSGADDHNVWLARFDPDTRAWTSHEVARAGGQLFGGSETDYTGLGALDPNDPNTLYISTEINPLTGLATAFHEIYKGVTADNGATWAWTAITQDSTVNNLRPIIPDWDGDHTALLWWRGTMARSQDYDAAVVGLILDNTVSLGQIHYIDADTANTTLSSGAPLDATTGQSTGADDGLWHVRTGVGNDGTVLAADESGAESVATLKTTVKGLDAGLYDLFVYFWVADGEDWRVRAGLSESDMILLRTRGAQQTDADRFDASLLRNEGGRDLYQGYLGRVELSATGAIDVFIDDTDGSGGSRVWYDGVGYALVTRPLAGDTDGDGDVDNSDLQTAIANFTGPGGAGKSADQGDTDGDGDIDNTDLQAAIANFTGPNPTPVPEPGTLAVFALALPRGCRRRRHAAE